MHKFISMHIKILHKIYCLFNFRKKGEKYDVKIKKLQTYTIFYLMLNMYSETGKDVRARAQLDIRELEKNR